MSKTIKILFIQDNLFLTPDANVKIVFRLIKYLLDNYNANISLVGRAVYGGEYVDSYHKCKLIHEPYKYIKKYEKLRNRLGKWAFIRYLLMPRAISYRIHNEVEPYVVEARKWLQSHVNEYDVIVATCSPYYPLLLAAEISKKCPVIFYKIDAMATFPIPKKPNKDTYLATIENEVAFDTCASKIITTDVIFKYYNQLPTQVNSGKVVLLNYPNIVERILSNKISAIVESFDQKNVNVSFVGKFYSDIRNPKYLFDMMRHLQSSSIILHLIGDLGECREMLEEYQSNNQCNIVYHGIVSPTEADDILLQSDILVHVGNAEDAYMPSKILDYMSAGKPILNICKIPTCPTLSLMERYPIGLTIYEYEELTEKKIQEIVEFCMNNKGKKIPFETISKIYYDSTISYVGQKFYEVIQSVINR